MGTTVFLSSTFTDLQEHRRLAQEAITCLEHQAKAMEFFGALPEAPKAECLRLVRESDIFVGVFGMRYGSVDVESGKSLTHLEYEEACTLKMPCLIYLIDEDNHPVLPKHVDVGEAAAKLSALKNGLRSRHVTNSFSSPAELASKVTQDLVRLVGARVETPTAGVLAQIARNSIRRYPLTEPRYRFLRDKVRGAFKKDLPDAILREALEVVLVGENFAASLVLSRGGELPLDDAVDGLMEVERMLKEIIARGKERLTLAERSGNDA